MYTRGLINLKNSVVCALFPFDIVSGPSDLLEAKALAIKYRSLIEACRFRRDSIDISYYELLCIFSSKEVVWDFLKSQGQDLRNYIPRLPIDCWIDGLPDDSSNYKEVFRALEGELYYDGILYSPNINRFARIKHVALLLDLYDNPFGWEDYDPFVEFYYGDDSDDEIDSICESLFGNVPSFQERGSSVEDDDGFEETISHIYFKLICDAFRAYDYIQFCVDLGLSLDDVPIRWIVQYQANLDALGRIPQVWNLRGDQYERAVWYFIRVGFQDPPARPLLDSPTD